MRSSPVRRLLIPTLAVMLVLVAWLARGPVVTALVRPRLMAAAAERGWSPSWRAMKTEWPVAVRFEQLVVTHRANGDTLFEAESLAVALDPWSFLVLKPRMSRLAVAHAGLRIAASRVEPDTVPPTTQDDPKIDPERSQRVRRSARALVHLLTAPIHERTLHLTLSDVTVNAGQDADALWRGARLAWLDLTPTPEGVRVIAAGSMLGGQDVPFEANLEFGRDHRLAGGARFLLANSEGTTTPLRLAVDGAIRQNRRAGSVTIPDTTRITIGELPLQVGGSLSEQGPSARFVLAADGITEAGIKRSLPAVFLGPLLDVGVDGEFDYRLSLHLDLAQPDSVSFHADVIPRGLRLDPARTRLKLFGLEEPFVAHVHLPHGRAARRDLSPANPHFRAFDKIAPWLSAAVVTNEDGGFFRHRGFNTEAVKGAIADNIKAGAYRRGAGTITMQLARNLYLGHERTLARKTQEVVLAWILEHLVGVSKQRLLEIYLNIIEWGPDVHGADEATRYYFDRDAGDVTVAEALFLASIVPSPLKWRYRIDAEGHLRRYARAQMHFIGRAMIAKGWLRPEDLPPADSLDIELRGRAREVLFPRDTTLSLLRPWRPESERAVEDARRFP